MASKSRDFLFYSQEFIFIANANANLLGAPALVSLLNANPYFIYFCQSCNRQSA
jgi:hypothetical protein